jgi:hypothetical protein
MLYVRVFTCAFACNYAFAFDVECKTLPRPSQRQAVHFGEQATTWSFPFRHTAYHKYGTSYRLNGFPFVVTQGPQTFVAEVGLTAGMS